MYIKFHNVDKEKKQSLKKNRRLYQGLEKSASPREMVFALPECMWFTILLNTLKRWREMIKVDSLIPAY